MSDWTSGYVAEIGYTFGYYPELNPLRARFALLQRGLACPPFKSACELGFGQGLSIVMHDVTSTTQWYGTDFNPAQVSHARELAESAGSTAKLFDQSFADFAARTDLPEFDFIGLHGVWSWISDENRRVLVEFIGRKLAEGGVLYVSYNTLPGWGSFAPIRQLMSEHAEVTKTAAGGLVSRIDDAVEFAARVLAASPMFARFYPQTVEQMKKLQGKSRHYLAHEFFNRDWHPMHFATMAKWLEPAKVEFVGTATLHDLIETMTMSAEQLEILRQTPDELFRESVRDFMVNQNFRRDYWVKGARKLSARERIAALRKQSVVLTTFHADVAGKLANMPGNMDIKTDVCTAVLALLADYSPKTIAQLESALATGGITFDRIMDVLLVLLGIGCVDLAQDAAVAAKTRNASDKLNAHLMKTARRQIDANYLASPVLGGGFGFDRLQQLFGLSMQGGLKQPAAWAEYAWKVLEFQGHKLVKDGKTIEDAAVNQAELQLRAAAFAEKKLPLAKALQILK